MRRYALRDDQWDRIGALLPGKAGGRTASDNRLFVEVNRPQFAGGSKVSMDGAYGKK